MKIALDFGGTRIKAAAFEDKCIEPVWFENLDAQSGEGMARALDRVKALIRSKGDASIEMIGIATPGIVDQSRNRVTYINGKYDGVLDVDFNAWCDTNFGCKLIMRNDANAALLGEVTYGCARGYENVVMLIGGTGVGTAAMMEGRMINGVHGQAGILGGHFILNPFGRGCTCGAVGCLETYVGFREVIFQAETDRGRVDSLIYHERPITMDGIVRAWRNGDAYAEKIMQNAIGYYAAAVVNMVHAYDPECIILSGGLSGSQEVVENVKKIVRKQAWLPWGEPEMVQPEKPEFSVLWGLLKEMNDLEDAMDLR